jgi:hypothetical protein
LIYPDEFKQKDWVQQTPSPGQISSLSSDPFPKKFGVKISPGAASEYVHIVSGREVAFSESVSIDSYWKIVCEPSKGTKVDSVA